MSYTKSPPRYISFFCEMPPQVGGETPLACSRKMFERMPEDIKDQFQENDGVKYVRFNLPQIRLFKPKKGNVAFSTWQSVFETDEAEEVEEICRREGLRVEWYRFGGLRTTLQLPAIREHPVTGEKTWFNQVHVFLPTRRFLSLSKYVAYRSAKALLYPKRFTFACFGNNKPIPTRTVDEINDVIDSLMVKFRWEKSDFLLIDNLNTSHGRMPYRGPRRILTAMS